MKLTESNTLNTCKHRVIIGNSKNVSSTLTGEDKSLFDAFLKQEEDFKEVSSLSGSVFLVRFNQDAEKNRVAGAKVRQLLNKEIEEIAFLGGADLVYDLLEGFLLSSYQFLKYFNDADKKEFKLENLLVEDAFGDDLIEELFDITTAVFWARDMVNEPVSFLTAEQLAEEIVTLGLDAELMSLFWRSLKLRP